MAPAAGASGSRLSNSTPVPVSYFTPVSNNSAAAQYVRVVTSNAPIQPKLLPGKFVNVWVMIMFNCNVE